MRSTLVAAALASMALVAQPLMARAAPIDIWVATTLQQVDPDDPSAPLPLLSLRGTLSYDADEASGSGTFTLAGSKFDATGFALVDDDGLLFIGSAAGNGSLELNFSTDPNGSGTANLCFSDAFCSFYTTIGGKISYTDPWGPSNGTDPQNPGTGSSGPVLGGSGKGLSAVPLPPSLPLSAAALLVLAFGSRALGRMSTRRTIPQA